MNVLLCIGVLLDNHMVLDLLILEGGTNRLSRNVDNELLLYTA